MFSQLFFGLGALGGTIMASIVTEYYDPYLGFRISSFVTILLTFTALFISDELETNEQAMLAVEFEKYELEYIKKQNPNAFAHITDTSKLSLKQVMKIKGHIIHQTI